MKINNTILFCIFVLLFSACNKEEEIPAYIHIPVIEKNTDYDTEGSASHRITDVWVVVGNEFIGAFELPVTFPVLMKGEHEVFIRAGIKDNGIAATRTTYPMYAPETFKLNLQPAKIDTLRPAVNYTQHANFLILEDFERSTHQFPHTPFSLVTPVISNNPDDVYEGSRSMVIKLDNDSFFFEIANRDLLDIISLNPTSVYLELNYKTDFPFLIGYYAISFAQQVKREVITINPTEDWNKIYVNLTSHIMPWGADRRFRIFIGEALPMDMNNGTLYLDNIKLVIN